MASATTSSLIACSGAPLQAVESDFLVVPWFEGETASAVAALDPATGGEIGRALASKEFSPRPYELFVTPVVDRTWRARRVALVGAGSRPDFTTDLARRLAASTGLTARQRRSERVAFVLRGDVVAAGDVRDFAQAVAEGLTLSEFNAGTYKTADPAPPKAPAWTIAVAGSDASPRADAAVARGRLLGECSNLARELANEPGNTLTPREFAARCERLVAEAGVSCDVLDEQQIAKLGMGLLLGVARGSSEAPRLMVFRYEPA